MLESTVTEVGHASGHAVESARNPRHSETESVK